MRELLAQHALEQVPRLLTLLDRNPHSPTYGCFDRNHWHYRIIDFPSGMAQEFVWPLALVYSLDIEGSAYYRRPVVAEWVRAGIAWAARSAHRDGSCDDYFPYERAAGAAAFSLLACLESYTLLGLEDEALLRFFERRADWLAGHEESGRLTNHHALTVLCLQRVAALTGSSRWDRARDARLQRILSWQHAEGWFPEYDGFDPGYHTLTISCLASLLEAGHADARLREAVRRAVLLAVEFVHPDGSFGGECGSRNTYNFFPHGFELAGRWLPDALAVNDRFLHGVAEGLRPSYEDDHLIAHHAWNYLLAWRDFAPARPEPQPRRPGLQRFAGAGLVIDRRGADELYAATGKGGVFKLFRAGRLVTSDTQLSLLVKAGTRVRNAVGHLAGEYEVELEENRIVVTGTLGWAKHTRMSTGRLMVLRLVMLAGGRLFPNLVRRLLQSMLITGKAGTPFRFRRTLLREDGTWRVVDELRCADWKQVVAAGIGAHQTSIYVVMSRVFQRAQLDSEWLDLTARVRALGDGEPLIIERTLA